MFKYRAFLSYSHADTRMAKRVLARLEGFHIDKELAGRETPAGTIPETLRPIFRDRHDFDAGGSLAQQTCAVLDGSAALIVLASPHAARSKFVNEEVRQFKSRHPERPVIPLIVDGEPGDPEKECFPPALRLSVAPDGAVTNIPVDVLAADLREKGDGLELALAKVVARMIGLATDDVYRRADRERRRQARQRRRVQALFYMLLIGIIGGLVGWINQAYIIDEWTWFTKMRPYMLANVRPYVLAAPVEHALRPGTIFRECAHDCPEMVVVPAGQFTMGSPGSEAGRFDNEGPQHSATIARPFAVSRYDVTIEEWNACAAVGGCPEIEESREGGGRLPVVSISWDDAKAYVVWFSEMTGRTYRLLSETEWEYVARAGTTSSHFWGDNRSDGTEYCKGCEGGPAFQRTLPVGSLKPNAFGLYDIEGNVWQLVDDCYHDKYVGAPTDGSPWNGAKCDRHVSRGGAANQGPRPPRIAVRVARPHSDRVNNVGFRIGRVLTLEAPVAGP